MPVGVISLPVSHLPSAASFYLAALQPLNYRFVEESEGRIGLGPNGTADFYLTQQLHGSPTTVSFDAPSAAAIDAFFATAIRFGASVYSYPILKDCETGLYAATIVDLDGNRISAFCEEPRMSTHSLSTARRASGDLPWALTRSNTDPPAGASVSGNGDGNFRVRITTTHHDLPPPPSAPAAAGAAEGEQRESNTTTNLVTTLLGVAAGAAIGYVVGKDKQSAPAIAQAVQAAPAAWRALESIANNQRAIAAPPPPAPVPAPSRGPQPRPQLARASTYYGSQYTMPWAIEAPPSPPSERGYQLAAPESGVYAASRKGGSPLMIGAPPSYYGAGSSVVSGHQVLPPSPSSAHSIASSHRSGRRSPSPPRSSASRTVKTSTRRSSSTGGSSRTVRQEDYRAPVSVVPSRASGSRHAHEYSLPPSEVTSVTPSRSLPKEQSRTVSKVSSSASSGTHSRRPHDYPLPASQVTTSKAPSKATTKASASARSRDPHEYTLPESVAASSSSKASFKTSLSKVPSRQPYEISLPASKPTSVVTASTLKPPRSALGLKKKGGDADSDDEESLAPSDSISQVSSQRHKRKVRRHRKKEDGEGSGAGDKDEKKRSVLSLPLRESKREKDTRGVSTQINV